MATTAVHITWPSTRSSRLRGKTDPKLLTPTFSIKMSSRHSGSTLFVGMRRDWDRDFEIWLDLWLDSLSDIFQIFHWWHVCVCHGKLSSSAFFDCEKCLPYKTHPTTTSHSVPSPSPYLYPYHPTPSHMKFFRPILFKLPPSPGGSNKKNTRISFSNSPKRSEFASLAHSVLFRLINLYLISFLRIDFSSGILSR